MGSNAIERATAGSHAVISSLVPSDNADVSAVNGGMEEDLLIDKPQIVQSPAWDTAFIRLTIPREEIQTLMGPGYRELMDAVAAQGITPAGPWFNHHLRMDPDTFDFQISVPVSTPISPVGRVRAGKLPASTVARTIYHGPYEGLPDAWHEFDSWIASEGLTPRLDLWECYLSGPESSSDPAAWRTELNQPLRGS